MDEQTRRKVNIRIKRAEGQLAAIGRMLDNGEDCVDVLLQMAAVRGALAKAAEVLLARHVETCVVKAIASGDEKERDTRVVELLEVLSRYGGIGGR